MTGCRKIVCRWDCIVEIAQLVGEEVLAGGAWKVENGWKIGGGTKGDVWIGVQAS